MEFHEFRYEIWDFQAVQTLFHVDVYDLNRPVSTQRKDELAKLMNRYVLYFLAFMSIDNWMPEDSDLIILLIA